MPDTEGCDLACNPVPSDASFGPQCINSATPGNTGSKPNSTHSYVNLVQGPAGVMGAEPQNATNTNFFQCNYSDNNPAVPWAPMVAWRPVVDTRAITRWYTCSGISSFYLELSFGSSTHNFEVYVVDDMNGGTLARSEALQVLDGDTGAVLWESGVFTNFSAGVYYKWAVTGHVKIKVTNYATNGRDAVINGVFFDPANAAPLPVSISVSPVNSSVAAGLSEQLIASVSNTPNAAVTWSISPSVGSISAGGVYTAPANITSVQTVTLRATSVADTTKSASATLTLLPPVTSVTGGPLVASVALGTLRNNYSGWVGFGFKVGSMPMTVYGLGRIAVAGNTQAHTVKLVDAASGADVPGGSASVMPGAATPGTFAYASLGTPVILSALNTYYVLSQETSFGEQWYDTDTNLQTSADATGIGSVYGTGSWRSGGSAEHTYGPVDVKYTLSAPTPPPLPAPVNGTAFVTGMTLGTVRNNYSGWVGTVLKVGSTPMLVSGLGRIAMAGNTQSHTVKLVDATTGLDVPNGAVSVTPAYATPGTMAYAALPTTVTLNALQSYYVVTQETLGGDQWHYYDTTLQTTSDASLTGAVYGGPVWIPAGTSGHSYGPVDVKYTLATVAPPAPISVSLTPLSVNLTAGQTQQFTATVANTSNSAVVWTISPNVGSIAASGLYIAPSTIATAQTVTITATSVADSSKSAIASIGLVPATTTGGTPFMSGMVLGTLRNNYSGWVGYGFTVNATPMIVSALGRIAVSGNSQNHVVKLVDAATGADVPNGAASITPSNAISGTIAYASLASSVTLLPGRTYYVVTQETFGADQWYDTDTTLQTTADATVTGSVYGTGTWSGAIAGSRAYGPVDFKYTLGTVAPGNTALVTGATLGTLRNNYSGWVGFSFRVGATPMVVSAVGRYAIQGNSQSHTVKLVDADTGADVPNGSASVAMSGATAGSMTYAALVSPVMLGAGKIYYLLTQETLGGDQWYDTDTSLQTTANATVIGSVYGTGAWSGAVAGNRTYGPVDLKY